MALFLRQLHLCLERRTSKNNLRPPWGSSFYKAGIVYLSCVSLYLCLSLRQVNRNEQVERQIANPSCFLQLLPSFVE